MFPHVGTLIGDKNGDVANNLNAAIVCIFLQQQPLPVETPLAEFPERDFFRIALVGIGERVRIAPDQLYRPLIPLPALLVMFYCLEQRKIVQPVFFRLAKCQVLRVTDFARH